MNQDPQPQPEPAIANPAPAEESNGPAPGAAEIAPDNRHTQAAAASVRGGRRVTFSLPSRRQGTDRRRFFRIPNGSRVTIRHRSNGQVHVHHAAPSMAPSRDAIQMVPVEALVPVPLHENLQIKHREPGIPQLLSAFLRGSLAEHDNEAELNFDCVICYDTLVAPVGCGNCSSRFCRPCLQAALHQHRQCPVCRSEQSEIIQDEALQLRMASYGVVCQYCSPEVFDGTLYPIGKNRIPHVDCPDLQVACRLAPYGCPWTGPRRHVLDHNCAYEPVTGLLECFRQHQMCTEELIRQRPPAIVPPPPRYSVFPHLMQFVVMLCTQPGQLQPESWALFVDARQNFEAALTCLPTAILQIKLFTTGLLKLLETIEADGTNDEESLLVEFSALRLTQGFCGFSFFVFLLGIWPSQQRGWRPITFRTVLGMCTIHTSHFSWLLALQAFLSQWMAFQIAKSSTRMCLMAASLMVSTLFVPTSMGFAANRTICPHRPIPPKSKAAVPLRVAIVFALMVQKVKLQHVLEGFFLCWCVVVPLLKRYGVTAGNDVVLDFLMKRPILRLDATCVFLLILPIIGSLKRKESITEALFAGCLVATLGLALYFLTYQLARFGEKAGSRMLVQGVPYGLVVFGCWCFSLFLLTVL